MEIGRQNRSIIFNDYVLMSTNLPCTAPTQQFISPFVISPFLSIKIYLSCFISSTVVCCMQFFYFIFQLFFPFLILYVQHFHFQTILLQFCCLIFFFIFFFFSFHESKLNNKEIKNLQAHIFYLSFIFFIISVQRKLYKSIQYNSLSRGIVFLKRHTHTHTR